MQSGFTLLELIVVILVIAMLATGSVAVTADLEARRSAQALGRVESFVELARTLAISRRRATEVEFDFVDETIGVRFAGTSEWLAHPGGEGPLFFELRGATLDDADFGSQIVFSEDGTPSSSGALHVSDSGGGTRVLEILSTGLTRWSS